MAFNDLDRKRIEKAMDAFLAKRRPPPHIRPDLDFGYRVTDQSVEILEIRPQWDDRSIIHERAIAKATFVKRGAVEGILDAGQPEVARL